MFPWHAAEEPFSHYLDVMTKVRQGQFKVIDSFAIRRRNEFYLIGRLTEGTIQPNWFINVPFNSSLSMTVRVKEMEDVEISGEENRYKLLIVGGDNEVIDLLLGLKIVSEYLDITIEGED
jgi:hypothetical protein